MADPQPIHNEPLPGFDGLYGLELTRVDADGVDARLRIGPQHHQAFGIVHGGVYASIAEVTASIGTVRAAGDGKWVAGMSNSTSFLRAVREGTIRAEARPLHVGRTTAIWDVELRDDDARLVASSRVTLAIREPR